MRKPVRQQGAAEARRQRGRREGAAAEGDRLRRSRRARDPDVHPGSEAARCLRRLGCRLRRPCPQTPVAPAPETGEEPARAALFSRAPAPIRSLPVRSPTTIPQAGSVSGPAGTHDPFAGVGCVRTRRRPAPPPTEDPVAAPIPGKIVVGTPTPGAVAKRGWIVVLASIQTRVGRPYAERFATRVERNGLGSVAVLDSSTRKPLRSGYFVVYTGPFATLAQSSAPRPTCTPSATGRRTSARSSGTRRSMPSRIRERSRNRARRAAHRDGRDEHRHLRARRGVQLRHRVRSSARARPRPPERWPTSRWRRSGAEAWASRSSRSRGRHDDRDADGRTYWLDDRCRSSTAAPTRRRPTGTPLDAAR